MENIDQLKTLAAALPAAVQANALDLLDRMSAVIEGIGDEAQTFRVPFMKIIQSTTDRGSIPKGSTIGDMILGEEKMEAPLKFIPFRLWFARQYWDKDPANTRMLCQSPDAKLGYIGTECKVCPHSVWNDGTNGEPVGSDCTKIYSMLAITADFKHIFNLNFAKTSYKVGQELEGAMKKAGVATYLRTYGLSTETHAKAKNVDIYKLDILDSAARKTPTEYTEFLKLLFDNVTKDRKAMLDAFYEGAARRKGTIMLANEGADTTLALPGAAATSTASVMDGTPAEVAVAENAAPAKVSNLSKKYSV